MNKKRAINGFTLLEILIAIFIFSIIVTTIFGSFRFVFFNTETLKADMATVEMVKNCLDRIAHDLQSIYIARPPQYVKPDINAPPEPYHILGEAVSINNLSSAGLRFTSLAHLPLEKGLQDGIAEITYYTQPEGDDHFILKRSDKLYPFEPFAEKESDPVLCEHLKSLKFIYYDHEGTEHDHWNSESEDFEFATPLAIGIKLEAGRNQPTIVMETRVTIPVYRDPLDKN